LRGKKLRFGLLGAFYTAEIIDCQHSTHFSLFPVAEREMIIGFANSHQEAIVLHDNKLSFFVFLF
jgi:hypothetical protein